MELVKLGSPLMPLPRPDGRGGWWSVPYVPDNAPAVRYLLHRVSERWVKVPLPVPVEPGLVRIRVPADFELRRGRAACWDASRSI